jgi:hypothetical protein
MLFSVKYDISKTIYLFMYVLNLPDRLRSRIEDFCSTISYMLIKYMFTGITTGYEIGLLEFGSQQGQEIFSSTFSRPSLGPICSFMSNGYRVVKRSVREADH